MTDVLSINNTLQTQLWNVKNAPQMNVKDLAKAEKSAEDFEAFFLTKMMETMFEGVSTDGMFGGGNAEKIYRSMLLDEYGKEMAKVGTVGVKQSVMRSILEMQEMASQGYIEG